MVGCATRSFYKFRVVARTVTSDPRIAVTSEGAVTINCTVQTVAAVPR